LREGVYILAQQTGWGLDELLSLEEDELIHWLDAGKRVKQQQERMDKD